MWKCLEATASLSQISFLKIVQSNSSLHTQHYRQQFFIFLKLHAWFSTEKCMVKIVLPVSMNDVPCN